MALATSAYGIPSRPSAWSTAKDFFGSSKGVKFTLKAGGLVGTVGAAVSSSPEVFSTISKSFHDAHNLIDLADVPSLFKDLYKRSVALVVRPSLSAFAGVVEKVCNLAKIFANFIKSVVVKLVPLSARALSILSFTGGFTTIVSSAFGLHGALSKLDDVTSRRSTGKATEKEYQAVQTNSFLEIAKNLHFAVLASLTLASLFTGFLCPPFVLIALTVGALAFTLLSHFHNKMIVEPIQKTKSHPVVI